MLVLFFVIRRHVARPLVEIGVATQHWDREYGRELLKQHSLKKGEIGKFFREFVMLWDTINKQLAQLREEIEQRKTIHDELQATHNNLEKRIQQVTSELQTANDQLSRMAMYDSLTGLPNRKYFEQRLSQSISVAYESNCSCALMFIDLDSFKQINDNYEHSIGDKLLVKISKRIKETIRPEDTLVRFDVDEFVISRPA